MGVFLDGEVSLPLAAVCAPPCQVLLLLCERTSEAQTVAVPCALYRSPGCTPPPAVSQALT